MIKLPIRDIERLSVELTELCRCLGISKDEEASNTYSGLGALPKSSGLGVYSIRDKNLWFHLYLLNLNTLELLEEYGTTISDFEANRELQTTPLQEGKVIQSALENIAAFILLGIQPCILSKALLKGLPFRDVRGKADLLSRCFIMNTMEVVHKYTQGAFEGVDLSNEEEVNRARHVIKYQGLGGYWQGLLRTDSLKLVPPFEV